MTIVRPRGQLWEHVCEVCDASWCGPEDHDCYWCDMRLGLKVQSQRMKLLWPEWMSWGDRYVACNRLDRTVWAETRGFTGDYRGKWKRELFNAIPDYVSAQEAADALRRLEKWMTHIEKFDNSLPNMT